MIVLDMLLRMWPNILCRFSNARSCEVSFFLGRNPLVPLEYPEHGNLLFAQKYLQQIAEFESTSSSAGLLQVFVPSSEMLRTSP
jgi:hypothetical protein